MSRRPSSMPISHWVRDATPETSKALLARGACPSCQRVAIYHERDVDGCAGPVAVCRACAWTDFDEQQAALQGDAEPTDLA
jgi:hypothetical protein